MTISRKLKGLAQPDKEKEKIRKAFSKSPSPSLRSINNRTPSDHSSDSSNSDDDDDGDGDDDEDNENESDDDDPASGSNSKTRDTPGSVKKLIEAVYGSRDSLNQDMLALPGGDRPRKMSGTSSSSCLPSRSPRLAVTSSHNLTPSPITISYHPLLSRIPLS